MMQCGVEETEKDCSAIAPPAGLIAYAVSFSAACESKATSLLTWCRHGLVAAPFLVLLLWECQLAILAVTAHKASSTNPGVRSPFSLTCSMHCTRGPQQQNSSHTLLMQTA